MFTEIAMLLEYPDKYHLLLPELSKNVSIRPGITVKYSVEKRQNFLKHQA
jgi:hypothetical protein